jgi:hypothetical protein
MTSTHACRPGLPAAGKLCGPGSLPTRSSSSKDLMNSLGWGLSRICGFRANCGPACSATGGAQPGGYSIVHRLTEGPNNLR